jgi:hypothetical protein
MRLKRAQRKNQLTTASPELWPQRAPRPRLYSNLRAWFTFLLKSSPDFAGDEI